MTPIYTRRFISLDSVLDSVQTFESQEKELLWIILRIKYHNHMVTQDESNFRFEVGNLVDLIKNMNLEFDKII